MPKKAPELAAYQVMRLKRPGKHAVGGVAGLLLCMKPGGIRSWVFRVQVGNRRPDIGLGGYPDVPLEQPVSERRSQNWINSLAMYAIPTIGSLPVDQAVLAWAKVIGHRTGENPAA